ncbi:MAG: DUF2061 domain-containing protein [Candidatus Thorarchaeota archaeon]
MIRTLKGFLTSRAFKKALTWRLVALTTLMTITYVMTGSLIFAGSIGVADTVFKTILYWVHEKLWEKVDDGDSGRTDREPKRVRSESEASS